VHAATRGVEVVFHQGALPSVPRSVQDPLTTSAVNVEGTLNVLLAARDEGIRRVVFASSSSVYGNSNELPRVETQNPDPISPYGVSKLAAERYCVSFARVYPLETVALRYFNVFGPNQDPTSQYAAVVPRFVTAIAEERPISVYGDGEQKRDFVYVDDAVDAFLRAGASDACNGQAFNVGGLEPTSHRDFVAMLIRTAGSGRSRFVEWPSDKKAIDIGSFYADSTRIADVLGWRPTTTLESGLKRTIAYYRAHLQHYVPEGDQPQVALS
jgi:UDP-glucose 4-epimerase